MLVESSVNVFSVLTKFFLAASHLRMSVVAIESMNTNCEHHQEWHTKIQQFLPVVIIDVIIKDLLMMRNCHSLHNSSYQIEPGP
jgi:hypothetical protein